MEAIMVAAGVLDDLAVGMVDGVAVPVADSVGVRVLAVEEVVVAADVEDDKRRVKPSVLIE